MSSVIKLNYFTFIFFTSIFTCTFKAMFPLYLFLWKIVFSFSKLVPNFALRSEGATNITRGPICHTLLLFEVKGANLNLVKRTFFTKFLLFGVFFFFFLILIISQKLIVIKVKIFCQTSPMLNFLWDHCHPCHNPKTSQKCVTHMGK